MVNDYIECKYCKRYFSKYGIKNHIGMTHEKTIINKGNRTKGRIVWNKGLTKDIDERVAKYSISISKTLKGKPGKPHSKESKDKLRKYAVKNKLGGHTSKKSIYYKTKSEKVVYLHSSYEKILAIELDRNNIRWERPDPILWKDDNNIFHRYYPDFFLVDYNIYLDPKNSYLRKKDKRKIELVQVQNNIKVLVLSKKELIWDSISAAIAQPGRADPL